jgi:hypothetical protein
MFCAVPLYNSPNNPYRVRNEVDRDDDARRADAGEHGT